MKNLIKTLKMCIDKEISLEYIKKWALDSIMLFLSKRDFKLADLKIYPFLSILAYQEYGVLLDYNDVEYVLSVLEGKCNYSQIFLFQLKQDYFKTEVITELSKIVESFIQNKRIKEKQLKYLSSIMLDKEENIYWMLVNLFYELVDGVPLIDDGDFDYCSVYVNDGDIDMLNYISTRLLRLFDAIKGTEPLLISIEYRDGISILNLII